MNLLLAEIAQVPPPGTHAVLLMDNAGWHDELVVPPTITLVPLPPHPIPLLFALVVSGQKIMELV